MGPKLLFLLGIIVAHGALGAVLMRKESAPPPPVASTCTKTPEQLPYFDQKRELLAMVVFTTPREESSSP